MKLSQLAGWYGVLALLGAYGLVSFGVIPADSLAYQLINISGALGIVAVAASKGDLQPAVLNLAWAGIGVVAILRLVF
ncbi:MAG: hypothetical protein KBC95_00475 [Candidatus Peribacteraceae bacterium]|nr:hypothetical protein [Candidatus Peribacteraceae bacterium]